MLDKYFEKLEAKPRGFVILSEDKAEETLFRLEDYLLKDTEGFYHKANLALTGIQLETILSQEQERIAEVLIAGEEVESEEIISEETPIAKEEAFPTQPQTPRPRKKNNRNRSR